MQFDIKIVYEQQLAQDLDQKFGPGVFFIVTKSDGYHLLACDDSTDAALIEQALAMAQESAAERKFKDTRKRLYFQIENVRDKILSLRYPQGEPSSEQAAAAEQWLDDQSKPCPSFISALAILDDLTPQQAAERLVGERQTYNDLCTEISTIQQLGHAAVLSATPENLKELASPYINQLSALKKSS